jgi:hypothetical protein
LGGAAAGGAGGSNGGTGGGAAGGGSAGGGAGAGGAAATPIDWADAWIAGFYGGAADRGTNRYDHVDTAGFPAGYYATWKGDAGATLFGAVSDCSSFSDVLMTKSYGWMPPTTHARPLAEDYYWAIRSGVRFQVIANVNDIARGDVIALLYGTSDSGGDSGHVAWIDSPPVSFSGDPQEAGLSQAGVVIVDSSHGFHYAPSTPGAGQDNRYFGKLASGAECTTDAECASDYGKDVVCNSWTLSSAKACAYTGVGRGRMRLYTDSAGVIAGYTWSTNAGSTYYPRPSPAPTKGASFTGRDIVVGRYVPTG